MDIFVGIFSLFVPGEGFPLPDEAVKTDRWTKKEPWAQAQHKNPESGKKIIPNPLEYSGNVPKGDLCSVTTAVFLQNMKFY